MIRDVHLILVQVCVQFRCGSAVVYVVYIHSISAEVQLTVLEEVKHFYKLIMHLLYFSLYYGTTA